MKQKQTFKITFRTGKSGHTSIYYNKENYIGCIKYGVVHLNVIKNDINEDGNPNCDWKTLITERGHETEKDAREWVRHNLSNGVYDGYKIKVI